MMGNQCFLRRLKIGKRRFRVGLGTWFSVITTVRKVSNNKIKIQLRMIRIVRIIKKNNFIGRQKLRCRI